MKKTAKNDVTGDTIKTKPASDKYRENYEKIFGKKEKKSGAPQTPDHHHNKPTS